jgi:hypothetical protein
MSNLQTVDILNVEEKRVSSRDFDVDSGENPCADSIRKLSEIYLVKCRKIK